MKLNYLRHQFYTSLADRYPKTEIQSFFNLLAEKVLKMNRLEVAMHLDQSVSDVDVQTFEAATNRLKRYEPIQYIIGHTEFYGLPFKVTPDTLIPRPETEELVEWVLDSVGNITRPTILDVGTGTGCIAIALAKHVPLATVYAIDVSTHALMVAEQNATLNEVVVNFLKMDVLNWKQELITALPDQLKFDVVVSNPPYVRMREKAEMSTNVLEYEPDLALFVPDANPFVFYQAITALASVLLKDNGWLFFEINQYLGDQMLELLQRFDFRNPILKKDMFGNDRMTSAIKKV